MSSSIRATETFEDFFNSCKYLENVGEPYAWLRIQTDTLSNAHCLVTDRRVLLFEILNRDKQNDVSLSDEVRISSIQKVSLKLKGKYSNLVLRKRYGKRELEKILTPTAELLRNWIVNRKQQLKTEDQTDPPLGLSKVKGEKSWRKMMAEMDGYQFEHFIAKLFEEMGYSTRVTKQSGDQGVDVIAETPFETLAIQTKKYTNNVSNSAIQEIVAAIKPSNADKAVVVTTSDFTKSAKRLAEANNVKLVDQKELLNLINQYL